MFSLTLEKLIIIGVFAALVIGPQRLPLYAHKLATLVRSFRAFIEAMKTRTESELGVPLKVAEWNAQLQQYDPRHVIREALIHDVADAPDSPAPAEIPLAADDDVPQPATRERWVVVGGSSGHPRRQRIVEPVPLAPLSVAIDQSHQEEEVEQSIIAPGGDYSPERPSHEVGRGEGTGDTALPGTEAQVVP